LTWPSARLLTDENVHPDVVSFPEQRAFDVLDVKRSGLVGSSDRDLLRRAYSDQRVVVTHDPDFGKLVIAADEPFYGIVYLRPGHLDPGFTIATLRSVLDADLSPEPPFILVAERQ
jgi:predicted nuclease of predicted toxin-antitoxin system